MIPLLALLLLAGGGAGAYFYMGKSEASTGEKAAPAKAEGKEGAAAVTYIPMDTIILPVIGRDGISQTISMVVSLQVNDSSKVEAVKELLPRLADAYLSDMYGNLTQASAMQGGVIKVSQLKARLTQITQKVAGEGMVDGVLLQVLQQHPG
jgi:flagellar FliL protein